MFRILLVDDELFCRQGLREIVDWESSGFEVIGEADNGEDALTFILENKPDVVITDIRMPVCDGLELINRVVNHYKLSTKFIILSGYDEFRYAQKAVKYGVSDFLLKPIDEIILQESLSSLSKSLKLEQQIEENRILYENEEIMYELLSQEWNKEEILQKYAQLGVNHQDEYCMIFVELNDYPYIKANERYKTQNVKIVVDTVSQCIPKMTWRCFFPMRGKIAVLFNHKWLPTHSSLQSMVKQMQLKLSEVLNMKVMLYTGVKASGLYFFEEAYRSALVTSQYKFIDNRMLYFADSLIQIQNQSPIISLSYEQQYGQLLIEVEEGNESQISQAVDVLFTRFSEQGFTIENIKSVLHKIVAETLQTLQTMQINSKSIEHLTNIMHVENYNLVRSELIIIVKQYLMEVSKAIGTERKEMAKGGIQRIKKYIDMNYSENISLKTIANKFFINPVYLGQLFKKTYDVYFNEYLLQVRIQEAKKMLRQTDLRIYEISEKVGFNHAEYFVAQFEKLEKLSPTAYRQTFNQQDLGEAK